MAGDLDKESEGQAESPSDRDRKKYWERTLLAALKEGKPDEVAEEFAVIIAALEKQRFEDPLTGLLTRAGAEYQLEYAIVDSERSERPLSVLMLDLDGFKQVNDTYGHQAGDEVIQTMAECLKANTRRIDKRCRWGGDEFVVICPNTGQKGAVTLGNKLRKALSALTSEGNFPVTTSVGVTTMEDYKNPKGAGQLISEADHAMYVAKQTKNNVAAFEDDSVVPA